MADPSKQGGSPHKDVPMSRQREKCIVSIAGLQRHPQARQNHPHSTRPMGGLPRRV
jgi:hypothetical protein